MNKRLQLETSILMLEDFREELSTFVFNGISLGNLPTHFWEDLGQVIDDLKELNKHEL